MLSQLISYILHFSDSEILSFTFAAQVDLGGATSVLPSITGGGLNGKFLAAQFHFHWGSVDTQGSEHTIEGNKYSMEVNILCFFMIQRAQITVNGFMFPLEVKNSF